MTEETVRCSSTEEAAPAVEVGGDAALLCRIGSRLCALPVAHVQETLRPLPIERLPTMAGFVAGVSVIRGAPVPIVDVAALLGMTEAAPGERMVVRRIVVLRVGARRVGLAVGAVLGVRRVAAGDATPPLLRGAGDDIVSAISTLDAELLLVLRTARIVGEAPAAPGGGAA